MAENKHLPTDADPYAFIASVEDEQKRADCQELLEMMERVTGEPPVMWGDSMVGFGSYHYKYASGREGDYFLTGFSPRKANLTIYILPGGFEPFEEMLARLGKFKNSVSCLYIKRLSDVDINTLEGIVTGGVARVRAMYPD
ncbi:MAG: DUF1801 domain-containing protein [Pseudomonadota bacterium]